MVIATIRPSTVDGIKQLAKKIKRERNILHTDALEVASRQAGFEGFVDARRKLQTKTYPIYLTAHWQARRGEELSDGRRAGRELLLIELQRPLAEIVARHRVGRTRGLSGFRPEYEDHLEHRTNLSSQENARDAIRTAVRSLRFMEATGLQAAATQKFRDATLVLDGLPGRDHSSAWFEPGTDRWIYLDEPYDRALENREAERRAWLSARSLHAVTPSYEGIYYPGHCVPVLIGADTELLARVAAALEKVQPVQVAEPWPHETGLCNDDFVSPQRLADAKKRRPRPGRSYASRNGATPYGGAPGVPSRWRPTVGMPFEQHRELGQALHILSNARMQYVCRNKLDRAINDLDNWAHIEHRDVAGVEGLYFGLVHHPLNAPDDYRKAAARAIALVHSGYQDCKPRRELLASLEAVAASIAEA